MTDKTGANILEAWHRTVSLSLYLSFSEPTVVFFLGSALPFVGRKMDDSHSLT